MEKVDVLQNIKRHETARLHTAQKMNTKIQSSLHKGRYALTAGIVFVRIATIILKATVELQIDVYVPFDNDALYYSCVFWQTSFTGWNENNIFYKNV